MTLFNVELMFCVVIFFFSSKVDAQEMKKEGKYCIWHPYYIYIYIPIVQDDLKSAAVSLYLKGAKLL